MRARGVSECVWSDWDARAGGRVTGGTVDRSEMVSRGWFL